MTLQAMADSEDEIQKEMEAEEVVRIVKITNAEKGVL